MTGVSAPRVAPEQDCGDAPLCLPQLRRPIGWRELDDATLVLRTHALLAARFLPAPQDLPEAAPAAEGLDLHAGTGGVGAELSQLVPSDAAYRDAWARMQAHEALSQESSADATASGRSPKGPRFPGWLLMGTLALAALQLLMWVVAVKPLEVIEVVRRSVREWQAQAQTMGSSGPKSEAASPETPLDPAHWWQSRQQGATAEHRSQP